MAHPDLKAEQAYVDHAYDCIAEIRRQLERVAEAVDAPEYQAAHFETWARKRLETFEDVERGLCFGRLELDGLETKLYVGRRWVHEDDKPLVVNWQAPAARPFYTATVAEPQGVVLRRRFRTEGRAVLDLFDEPLDGSAGDIVHGVADILLEELDRSRDDHMRDIVATIQADQYRLITREPEGVLVIQGGPGTGKTAVGLHRASWLLYTHRAELERNGVLVVGPNPIFMDYISHVLPMLGEDRVEQRAIDQLAGFAAKRVDPPEIARAKGDARMADALRTAMRALPAAVEKLVGIRIDGAYLYLEPEQVADLIGEAHESSRSYAESRERFRAMFVRRLYEQYARKLDDLAFRSFDELEKAIRTFTNSVLDQAFPKVKPEQLVRRVLADEGYASRGWSDADLPLLDEARALLEGPPTPHGHVIVDEAQDLTPMQLRMLARRSTGPMTILGDIAQASGAVSYHRWEEVLEHIAGESPVEIAELRLAYRVPREVMELALPLLPLIAPDAAPPIAYRSGDEPPRFVEVSASELVTTAAGEAAREALREGRTALIAPASLLKKIDPALGAVHETGESGFDELSATVRTLTPRAAKGLEFDRVILVEPAAVVDELGGVDGLRALYVALTRATKTLVIVHARPLPDELAQTA
jgi:DNA helicase IV